MASAIKLQILVVSKTSLFCSRAPRYGVKSPQQLGWASEGQVFAVMRLLQLLVLSPQCKETGRAARDVTMSLQKPGGGGG